MTDEERFQRWQQWIEEICNQVTSLFAFRHIYKVVRQIVVSNPRLRETPSIFWWWLDYAYGTTMLIGLRRLVDRSKEAISLYRLLDDIRKHPEALSRERYRRLLESLRKQQDDVVQTANAVFDELCGRGKPHIDPKSVDEDLTRLDEAARKVRELADKRVAHYDQKSPQSLPTHKDIDECLDLIGEIVRKYHRLMKGGVITLMPVIADDWTAIFKIPWQWKLTPEQQERLTALLQKSKRGALTPEEAVELDALIDEAYDIALAKARAEWMAKRG
jgi:hypothetical protein